MKKSLPKLIAHRGYAASYPENTLLAMRAAVEAGANYLEFDVQLSADKVPVLFHDHDLQRMCGQDGAIHEYPLSRLRDFSASEFARFGYRFVGNPITTLQEMIDYLAELPRVFVFLELKRQSLGFFGIETVLDVILPMLEPIKQRVTIISYSLEALLAVRERSGFPIGAVCDYWRGRKQLLVKTLRPEYFFTDVLYLPRFGKLKQSQCQVAVYECADPEQAIHLHQRGVEFVETFAIAEMLGSFKLRTDWS